MAFYKFCMAKHVQSILWGTMRLGTLEHFRSMEVADDQEWIADRLEGVSTGINDEIRISGRDPNIGDNVMIQGAHKMIITGIREDTEIVIGPGTHRIVGEEFYILCLSREPFKSARKAMCVDAPDGYRYDSCVEISDVEQLYECIVATGKILGRPIHHWFSGAYLEEVTYDKRERNIPSETMFDEGPFCKPSHFSAQQEFRIAFRPREPRLLTELGDSCFVTFDPPDGLLSLRACW